MSLFNKNNKDIPGKVNLYKLIEGYRLPNQKGPVHVGIIITRFVKSHGLVKFQLINLNGNPVVFIARLKDLIELHEEEKIYINGMLTRNNSIQIQDIYTGKLYITNKNDITYLPLNKIDSYVSNSILISINNEQ